MEKELVPEIHDIGKLINKESTKIEHNFENYPGKFEGMPKIKENTTWKGIREHHCQLPTEKNKKPLKEYPKSKDTAILCIADNLASTVSRHIEIRAYPSYNVYKLWNPTTNINRLSDAIKAHSMGKEWVKKIVNFVNKNPGKEEYLKEFGEYLKRRCEDAYPGCNITSLFTHSILTGKFYNILKKINIPIQIDFGKEKEHICNLLNKELPEKIELTLMKCKIKLPKYIYRTKDMNIIEIRKNLIKKLENYPEVFFRTSDEIIIFSKDENILDKLKDEVEKYGLIIEIVRVKSRLSKKALENKFTELLSNKGEKKVLYPRLQDEIPSNINLCEICQLNPVKPYEILSDHEKQLVTDEETGIVDKLCEKCIEVRKYGKPLKLLSEWREGKVIWIKITLDFKKLVKILKELYIDYLGSLKIDNPEEKAEIRPSVIGEFQLDYNEFLKYFNQALHENFNNKEKVQDILDDFFCIKIEKLSEIINVIEIYNRLVNKYFPKFKETKEESPIKLLISCSHVKFPFFEHWRYLENPKNDIEVMLIGKGKIGLKLSQLENLLSLKLKDKTALEKLAKMAETSEQLAWMQIFSEKGIKNYSELQKVIARDGFKLSDLLTYVKIKSD